MFLRSIAALGLSLILAAPLSAQCAPPGYAIQVTAADGAVLDSTFLNETVRAVAQRWATPSVRRADFVMWRRVRERTLPEVPRWADDWRPADTHKAEVILVIRRRGSANMSDPSPASGDRLFDRSLETIVRDPLPGSPDLPALPASVTADSVALRIAFGAQPSAPTAGVIEFPGIQTEVIVQASTLNVEYTRRAPTSTSSRATNLSAADLTATVKYDVNTAGTVEPTSIQIVETTDRGFGRAIQDALLRARFTAATTNCRPVRISVLQRFGN